VIWPVPPEVRRELKHLRESNTELRNELTVDDPRPGEWNQRKNMALDNLLISISRLLAAFGE
jgi:hypothetical protein